ncbi:uncharacterized protein EAE98_010312 [Botrytis deweyae]|uniref:Clr5 domain-containing protein n=1 Tax=Botrytis deweyae TaxID=2478750 RepID=A0ABQ7I934_9HELO|nr:uncharacterized protein EAE98_010312 [Botrytis deweyae]KAF7917207.1 hypothetical protein EAE98_010312 [Botrytis deweyae]
MQRKFPRLYGSRPIDAPYQGLGIPLSSTSHNLAMHSDEVKAAICDPPCICVDCEQGFYTRQEQMHPGWFYRRSLSSDEAKQIAASYINVIQQDRKYLTDRLAKYGDIIVNRWKKKSQDKRQALLLEAIPNLCKKGWIIPRHGFTPEGKQIPPINSDGQMELRSLETHHHLLLNWLNLEVLKTNPAVLFALLHNRTVYAPQDWASFDSRQLKDSFLSGHFDVDFSAKCIVMYGLRYGEVVDWKAAPAHRADILGFPKARLVIEAQAHLMGSLRRVVDGILQGIDGNTPLAAEKWKSMVSLGFRHSNVVELWSPYTNQAFSSPPSFSPTNLISLAQTRLEATVDHLWLLQTEPAYMKRYIAAMCHGGAYESTKDMGPGWLVLRGITEAIKSCWRWGWAKNECELVKSIHDRFRDNIAQGEDLPSKYDKALGALELLVVNDVNRRGDLLGKTISQRPGFSHIYTTTRKSQEHGPDILEVNRKNGLLSDPKYAFENELLDYCLVQLQIEPDIQQTPNKLPKEVPIDHALLFSILENHLTKSNIKEKSRLDEVLSNLLSDLAASHEMLAAIRLHRPLSRPRTLDEVFQSEKRKTWKAFNVRSHFTNNDACTKLGKAFFKNFHEVEAPTGRKDMAWLNHSQNTRKALEAFWQGIRKDSLMVSKQNGFTEDEVAEELGCISATTTQEYLSAVQAEERQLLAQIEQNQNTKINQKSQKSAKTPTQTTWGTEDLTSTLPTQIKAKDKTRPSISTQPSPTNPQELANYLANTTISPSPPPKILVTKRAYEILSHMYPCTAEDASTKSIEWDLFVHSMSDMGFCARNKGGSAVGFEREFAELGEGERENYFPSTASGGED